MSIKESNKLIAVFMGYEYYHPAVDIDRSDIGGLYERLEVFSQIPIETDEYPEDDQYYIKDGWWKKALDNRADYFFEAKYHESWDWLIPVVEKIYNTYPGFKPEQINVYETFASINIESTYNSVLEFIKLYNKNN